MNRSRRLWLGVAAAVAGALLVAVVFFATHVRIDGTFYKKGQDTYDLTDHELTAEAYREICDTYPDSTILWQIPFQGQRYDMTTEKLTVAELSAEEAEYLALFENLKTLDGTACTDITGLVYLQQLRPECQVLWNVELNGERYEKQTREVTLQNADAANLAEMLPLLPQLETVTLEGTLPEPEELLALIEQFPQVSFRYTLEYAGLSIPWDCQTLDLTGMEVTKEALAEHLPLLPELQKLTLTDTPLTDGEKKELAWAFPDVYFRCSLDFAGVTVDTDAEEIDISGKPITVAEVEAMVPLFPNLQKLVMADCGIPDEEMEALNNRFPDTSIVWTVQIGIHTVRTDAYYFFPAGVDEAQMPHNEDLLKLRYCTEMIAIDIGHTDAVTCEWVAYMPHLKYLILADTPIVDISPLSTCKELIYLELFIMDVVDYSPLLGCTALQDLNIGTTYGDPEPISKMTWLHHLQWNHGADNPEYHDEVLKLEEQLPDTVVIIDTWRNIGGPWRFLPHYYVFRAIIDGVYFNQISTSLYWGRDAGKVLSCEKNRSKFAGTVLAELVRKRIDNGDSIVGIKDGRTDRAEALYESLLEMEQYWKWKKD